MPLPLCVHSAVCECVYASFSDRLRALCVYGLPLVRAHVRGIIVHPFPHRALVAPVSYTHLTLPTICSV
eukprot:12315347-Alexandrium_andersonii.AAC.1